MLLTRSVDPSTWPLSVESPWLDGDANAKQLCERVGLEGPAIKRASIQRLRR